MVGPVAVAGSFSDEYESVTGVVLQAESPTTTKQAMSVRRAFKVSIIPPLMVFVDYRADRKR
jgi:hypothetical protein